MKKNVYRCIALIMLIIFSFSVIACGKAEQETAAQKISGDPVPAQTTFQDYFDSQTYNLLKEGITEEPSTFMRDGIKITVNQVISDHHFNYALISIGAADGSAIRESSVSFVSDYGNESVYNPYLEPGKSEVVYPDKEAVVNGVSSIILKTYENDFFDYRKMKAVGNVTLSNGQSLKVEMPFVLPFMETCKVKKGTLSDSTFVKAELSPMGFWFSKIPGDESSHNAVLVTDSGEEIALSMDESVEENAICMFEKPMDISKISEVRLDGEVITLK